MRKTLVFAIALTGALALPASALADSHDEEPPPPPPMPELCGGVLDIELIVDRTKFKPLENGFQQQGQAIVRISDEDSSVDIRVPGRLVLTEDLGTGLRTIVLSGQNLLVPVTEGQLDAQREAGLPDLALVKGRVVLTEQITAGGAEGPAVPGSERVVSFTKNVTDVCALLDEPE